ncbi:type IX secretion system periplasmic lipoprotein PorW/SprE [Pseudofulvibacter geojedonensis]
MKKHFKYILSLVVVAFVITSCSRRKDRFLNRNFHAVTTKYNILYNGDIAFQSGKDALIESFYDDYWNILPVERMEVSDDLLLPGTAKNPNFERAEEKAVKAIQKHSMNISGKEKNPQADEAYLLLGKARYFDQRFIPALEAFNYILYKYPASDKINHAKVWREKVNIRLENTELAIKNLKRLIEKEDIEKQDVSDAHAMLAQAYINNKHLDSALPHIKIAVDNSKDKEVKGRLGYIKGQLYNRLGYKDSANSAFDEIIKLKRKTLRVYYINAHVAKARNFDFEKGNKLEYSEHLDKLIANRENRPYLDKLYNLKAVYYQEGGIDSLAQDYYNKSVRLANKDKYLKSLDYRALGDYKFDATEYKLAGAYYDSTMLNLKKNTKEFRFFKKKRDNLKDVIAYEDEAKRNDSIIKVLNYTDDERIAYYEKHIKFLKQQDSLKKVVEANKLLAANLGGQTTQLNGKPSGPQASFYFYNPNTIAYGKNEFRKQWGDRKLEDNWRRSDKGVNIDFGKEKEEAKVVEKLEEKDIYKPEFYLAQLPTEKKQIDSIVKKRNFAYYQLGLIYKQKFKEYPLSANRLEKLIKFKPAERLELPAKYQLYKVYSEMNNSARQESIKNDIITNYPSSRYAEILRNPAATLSVDEGSPEVIYNKLYKQFEKQEYEEVLELLEKYILQFEGEPIVAKYEFLKATVIGKIQGFNAYKKAVNYVALNYPNTDEGKGAQQLMQKSIPVLEKLVINKEETGRSYKLVYVFDKDDTEKADKLQEAINKGLKETYRNHLKVSKDYYSSNKQLVVVHGFITPELGKNFHYYLEENKKKYPIIDNYKILSSHNYKTVQIHKNLDLIP